MMDTTDTYRYPGSRPFQDTDHDRRIFFGREQEAESLLHLILAENLVVLFAKSGMGKTSLLNAGVLQPLRERGFLPLKIRFHDPHIDPLQSVYAAIAETAALRNIDYHSGEQASLWHYFKGVEFWAADDTLLTPVLILDQFEEFFHLYLPEKRQAFISQFADLVKGRKPQEFQEDEPAYTDAPPNVKVIIAIREDFIGQLEEMAREIPAILQNRFRILPLNREQARQAIVEPAGLKDTKLKIPPFHYTPEIIEKILSFLCKQKKKDEIITIDEVEPFQLQLLCQYIENIAYTNLLQCDYIQITEEFLGNENWMKIVLQDFYDDQIYRLNLLTWKKKKMYGLFEKGLISANNRRLSLEEGEIERRFKVSKHLLSKLVNNHLLRSEPRVGSVYYELSHDSLIEAIQSSKRKRQIRKIGFYVIIWVSIILCLSVFFAHDFIRKANLNNFNTYYSSGITFYKQKKYDTAVINFQKAIQFSPDNIDTYIWLGEALSVQKQYDEAITVYQKAIKIDTRNIDLYENLGEALYIQGKYHEAVINFEKAIELAPRNDYFYQRLENIFITQHKYYEIMDYYVKAILLDPLNEYLHDKLNNLESRLAEEGNYNDAMCNFFSCEHNA